MSYQNKAWIILPPGAYEAMPREDRSRYSLIVTREKGLNFFIHKNRINNTLGWSTIGGLDRILDQHDRYGGA